MLQMHNIPTDLLRTLVTVVELRSFTKAAQILGLTQPAVSSQIKRLQTLLNTEIFDRSVPGVLLTDKGHGIVSYAQRLLAINDQIFEIAEDVPTSRTISIGLPGDLSGPLLPWTLAKFRKHWPHYQFVLRTGATDVLLSELRQGSVDVVVGKSEEKPVDARYYWHDELVWARSAATRVSSGEPVPMLAFSKECLCYQLGVKALARASLDHRVVFTASSVLSLAAAVEAGLGTMVMGRQRLSMTTLQPWEDAPLPRPGSVYVGIYIREEEASGPLVDLADELAPLLRPKEDENPVAMRPAYKAINTAFDKAAHLTRRIS